MVDKTSGKKLIEIDKLIRSLHFSDKADLVMTTFYYEPPSEKQDKEFRGDVSAAYAWATQVVEVEVDTETGIVKLLKVTGAHDVGRVINRLGIEGQVEGGVVMGQGYALTENLIVENGVIRNPNFRDYKLVTAPEIPDMDISFIEINGRRRAAGRQGRRRGAGDLHRRRRRQRHLQRDRRAHHGSAVHARERLPRAARRIRSRRPGSPPHDAAYRSQLGASAVVALGDAALRAARLARHPHRGDKGGSGLPGDPNRYIGGRVADDDRRSYFIAPNVGKEAIALNLKDPRGQEVLQRLITALNVDVFCCNTVPSRYTVARHRLSNLVGGQAGPDLGRHFGDGTRLSRRPRLRSGDPGDVRLHGGHRRSEGFADARWAFR